MKYPFDFNQEKNLILKETRGINFEDIIKAITTNNVLDDIKHPNPQKYPNQKILIINVNQYIYAVPYIIDHKRKVIFLKTIYPNRKLTAKYLK